MLFNIFVNHLFHVKRIELNACGQTTMYQLIYYSHSDLRVSDTCLSPVARAVIQWYMENGVLVMRAKTKIKSLVLVTILIPCKGYGSDLSNESR